MKLDVVVIGLGYVGLPLAVSFSSKYSVMGFDIDEEHVKSINNGKSSIEDISDEALVKSGLKATSNIDEIKGADYYIVAVPTPIGVAQRPNLQPMTSASRIVAKAIKKGSVICYESTVYPGVTEDMCVPIIEKESGLVCGKDFFVGYSPERINPGDEVNTLENIVKIVSGQDEQTADKLARLYGSIIKAGIHVASSIKVAEAAKVLENTQRDLNIALMNESAQIFDLFGIKTIEVLEAAGTKWNFLQFYPGLVGGHCIGVDPYYLTYGAQARGYIPEVILAGRRINDSMGNFVAEKVVRQLCKNGMTPKNAKVGIMGLAFKENISDLRNSKVADIFWRLNDYDIEAKVHDAFGEISAAKEFYNITLSDESALYDLDALIIAVPHNEYLNEGIERLMARVKNGGIFMDVKSAFYSQRNKLCRDIDYLTI